MKLLPCVLLALLSGMAQAEEFVTKVIAVIDGDTVLIRRAGGVLKVRLAEIDAPEKDQPFGASAQRSLSDMVLGKQVRVVSRAMDQYGRMVAHLNVGGLDVNTEQIRRGMAWEYSFHHSNRELVALEAEARQQPRGLWAMSAPVPPWQWRKQHPHTFPSQPAATDHASCGPKKHCADMRSCEEARHYYTVCGLKYLDGNGDGIPCEKLCAPRTAKIPAAK